MSYGKKRKGEALLQGARTLGHLFWVAVRAIVDSKAPGSRLPTRLKRLVVGKEERSRDEQ